MSNVKSLTPDDILHEHKFISEKNLYFTKRFYKG